MDTIDKVVAIFKTFGKDENGAALVGYTVLTGILLMAVIAAIASVGAWTGANWSRLNASL